GSGSVTGEIEPGGQVAIGSDVVVVVGSGPLAKILVQPIVRIAVVGRGNVITVDEQVTLGFVVGNDTLTVVGSFAVMVVTVEKVGEDVIKPGGMSVGGVVIDGSPPAQVILIQSKVKIPTVGTGNEITVDEQVT